MMPIAWVAVITIFAGVVGGYAACKADVRGSDATAPTKTVSYFLIMGVVAAACVPLFLSLLQSELVQSMVTPAGAGRPSNLPPVEESYLIYLGLCLVASFYARRFMDSISGQLLKRLDHVEETTEATQEEMREVAKEVENADNVSAPTSADLAQVDLVDSANVGVPVDISAEERKILEAMTAKTYRTRTGIAEDSGVSRNRISELLEGLADKKLVLPAKSPRTGGARWIITKRGRETIGRPD